MVVTISEWFCCPAGTSRWTSPGLLCPRAIGAARSGRFQTATHQTITFSNGILPVAGADPGQATTSVSLLPLLATVTSDFAIALGRLASAESSHHNALGEVSGRSIRSQGDANELSALVPIGDLARPRRYAFDGRHRGRPARRLGAPGALSVHGGPGSARIRGVHARPARRGSGPCLLYTSRCV